MKCYLGGSRLGVRCRGENQDIQKLLPEVSTEVLHIPGDEVGRASSDGSAENRPVFLRKINVAPETLPQAACRCDLQSRDERIQTLDLVPLREVSAGLLDCVFRGHECRVGHSPEPGNSGILTVGGGEQHVGVEEQPIHGSAVFGGLVPDVGGIQPQLSNLLDGAFIVLRVHGI